MTKILYFHHADKMGGAPLSLFYLIKGLPGSGYSSSVCCLVDDEVAAFYREHGIETMIEPGITTFAHTTGGWYPLNTPLSVWRLAIATLKIPRSVWKTYQCIKTANPDIVHLNSLTLIPSAIGARLAGVPLVWHIRETVHSGHFGIRKRVISWLVQNLPDTAIFISKDSQRQLASKESGRVIYNFVDFTQYDRHLDKTAARQQLGIPAAAKVALFLGGAGLIKGALPLSQALPLIKQQVPDFICLVAGRIQMGQARSLGSLWRKLLAHIGQPTNVQKVQSAFAAQAAEGWVRLLGFRTDAERLLAASDVLVFPAVVPHFARPVIEAGAMAKPVVASRIGGVVEVVEHNQMGLLVAPNDPAALADSIITVLNDAGLAARLGEAGYRQALQRFDSRVNVAQTLDVYKQLLSETV